MKEDIIETLTDDELSLLLFIINVKNRIGIPDMVFEPRHLKWFRHGMLAKRVLDVFHDVKPEGHDIYSSLLTKMGVQHEIRKEEVPMPTSASVESQQTQLTGSISI